jgi:hypothetical protein
MLGVLPCLFFDRIVPSRAESSILNSQLFYKKKALSPCIAPKLVIIEENMMPISIYKLNKLTQDRKIKATTPINFNGKEPYATNSYLILT